MSDIYLVPAPHLTHGAHLAAKVASSGLCPFYVQTHLTLGTEDTAGQKRVPCICLGTCLPADRHILKHSQALCPLPPSLTNRRALILRGPEWISPALLSPRALNASSSNPVLWITGIQLFPKCLPLCEAQNSSRKTELSLSTGTDPFYSARKAFFFFMAEYIDINCVPEIGLQAKVLITTFSVQWWLWPLC